MKIHYLIILLLFSGQLMAQSSSRTSFSVNVNELSSANMEAGSSSAGLQIKSDKKSSVLAVTSETAKKDEKLPATFAVQILQNNAAGFYPLILGSFGLNSKISFTYYGVFWTNASFGTLESGGDLWFEYGAGIGFKAAGGKLFVNPSLGFTNGKFLSGGAQNVIGDGIVPSVFALFNHGHFETEFYLSYYKALRSEGPVTRDFVLNWVLPGFKIGKHLALGMHYEQFVNTRVTNGDAASVYQWLGGYVRLTAGKGYSLRISAGKNLYDGPIAPEFYKISVFLPLLQ